MTPPMTPPTLPASSPAALRDALVVQLLAVRAQTDAALAMLGVDETLTDEPLPEAVMTERAAALVGCAHPEERRQPMATFTDPHPRFLCRDCFAVIDAAGYALDTPPAGTPSPAAVLSSSPPLSD